MAADEQIGSVSVGIRGDYSELGPDFDAAVSLAVSKGSTLSDAIEAALKMPEVAPVTEAIGKVGDAVDKAAPQVQSLGEAAKKSSEGAHEGAINWAEFGGEMLKLGGIALTAEALLDVAKEAFAAADAITATRISLTHLTGSSEEAGEMLERLEELEKTSAISMETLSTAAIRMENFLPVGTDIVGTLGLITDASVTLHNSVDAVANKFDMLVESGNASARALGSLGIRQQELLDTMQEMGVPLETLAKGAKDAFKALDQEDRVAVLTEALKKFQGTAAEVADNTIGGQWARAVDEFEDSLRDIANQFRPIIVEAFPYFIEGIKYVITSLQGLITFFKVLSDAVVANVLVITQAGKTIGTVWADVMSGQFGKAAMDAKAGWETIQSAFSAGWEEVKKDMQDGTTAVQKLWEGQKQKSEETVDAQSRSLTTKFSAMSEEVVKQIQTVTEASEKMLYRVPEGYAQYLSKLSDGGQKASSIVGELTKAIDNATEVAGKSGAAAEKLQPLIDKLEAAREKARAWADSDAMAKIQDNLSDLTAKFPDLDRAALDTFNSILSELQSVPGAVAANGEALTKWLGEVVKLHAQVDEAVAKTQQKFDKAWTEYVGKLQAEVIPVTKTMLDRMKDAGSEGGAALVQLAGAMSALGVTMDGLTQKQREEKDAFDVVMQSANSSWQAVEQAFLKAQGAIRTLAETDLPAAEAEYGKLIDKMIASHAPIGDIVAIQKEAIQAAIDWAARTGDATVKIGDQSVKVADLKIQLHELELKQQDIEHQEGIWDTFREKMEALKTSTAQLKDMIATDLAKAFSDTFTAMSRSISDVIVDGGKWKDAFLGYAKDIAKSILDDLINAALTPLKDALIGLISGDGFGSFAGLGSSIASSLGGLTGLGSAATVTTGVMSTAGSAISSAASAAAGMGEAASTAAGTASAGVQGMGSAASSAMSSITGMVGAIGSVIGAVGSIGTMIGTFRLEGTLNAIEGNTRIAAIILRDQIWALMNGDMMLKLGYLEWILKDLNELIEDFRSLMGADPNAPNPIFSGMLTALQHIEQSMSILAGESSAAAGAGGGQAAPGTGGGAAITGSVTGLLSIIAETLMNAVTNHLDWIMKDLDLIASALQNGIQVSGAIESNTASTASNTSRSADSGQQTADNTGRAVDQVAALQDKLGKLNVQFNDLQGAYQTAQAKASEDAETYNTRIADTFNRYQQDMAELADLNQQIADAQQALQNAIESGDEDAQIAAGKLLSGLNEQAGVLRGQLKQDWDTYQALQQEAKDQAARDQEAIDVAKQTLDSTQSQLNDVIGQLQNVNTNITSGSGAGGQAAELRAAIQALQIVLQVSLARGDMITARNAQDQIALLKLLLEQMTNAASSAASTASSSSSTASSSSQTADNTSQTAGSTADTNASVREGTNAEVSATTSAASIITQGMLATAAANASATQNAITQALQSLDFSAFYPTGYTGSTSSPPFAMGSTGLPRQASPPPYGGQWMDMAGVLHVTPVLQHGTSESWETSYDRWITSLKEGIRNYQSQINAGSTDPQIQSQLDAFTQMLAIAQAQRANLTPNGPPPLFERGGLNVRDQMAYLHAGEVVIPADVVRAYNTVTPPSFAMPMGSSYTNSSTAMVANVVINVNGAMRPMDVAREVAEVMKRVSPKMAARSA